VIRRLLALAAVLAGCSQSEYVRVDGDVYISKPLPALERAARAISSARRENEVAGPTPELTVTVSAESGLGPEEFRITVEESVVRIEGGGAAGAFYGGLEAAARIREGLGGPSLALARSGPRFELRIIRSALRVPALSPDPATVDWAAFLDRISAARWNTLALECRNAFPAIVRLARFPKAFAKSEGAARLQGWKKFLALAEERNLKLLLFPTELEVPDAFLRHYAATAEDRQPLSPLSQSFLRECLAETLKAYPQVAGIGVTAEALRNVPAADREGFARSVFIEGIRTSGKKAYLFLAADAAAQLPNLTALPGIEVIREVELAPAALLAGEGAERGRAAADGSRVQVCARVSTAESCPAPPPPERCAELVARLAGAGTRGLIADLFDAEPAAAAGGHLAAREGYLASALGLAAFTPEPGEDRWQALWEEAFGPRSGALVEPAAAVNAAFAAIARHHAAEPPWSILAASEAEGTPAGRGLRDDVPYLSLIEFVFSRTADPGSLSVPELVALEVKGTPPGDSLRTPLQCADEVLARASACLKALEGVVRPGADAAAADPTAGLALELEAAARLAEFHGRRIRAGMELLRHAAGIAPGGKGEAEREMELALAGWSRAETVYAQLRERFPGSARFPDLRPLRSEVEKDLKAIIEARPDPSGFRASPLLAESVPFRAGFRFECVRGFLDLGAGLLDSPAVKLAEEGQLFEAEDFPGGWVALRDIGGASGTGCASSGSEGETAEVGITLRLLVERPGTRHIWARAIAGGGGRSPSFRLRAGGKDLKATHEGRDGARRLTWEKAGEANFPAGEVFLQVLDAGSGREAVDAIAITTDGRWTPPVF
jgi:hypothetical protein